MKLTRTEPGSKGRDHYSVLSLYHLEFVGEYRVVAPPQHLTRTKSAMNRFKRNIATQKYRILDAIEMQEKTSKLLLFAFLQLQSCFLFKRFDQLWSAVWGAAGWRLDFPPIAGALLYFAPICRHYNGAFGILTSFI